MLKSSSLCLYSSNLGTFWLKIEQFWSFLTYITGFFMNFELLPILTDYEIKLEAQPTEPVSLT
jgi:hypothetical protein